MTIVVSVLTPEGIVLASDSRQISITSSGQLRVNSDQADKIFPLNSRIAATIIGQSFFYCNHQETPRSIGSHFQLVSKLLPKDCTVREAANFTHQALLGSLNLHVDITGAKQSTFGLFVAGYDMESEIGELYRCEVPGDVVLERRSADAGAVWSGQREIIDRLIYGYDPRLLSLIDRYTNTKDLQEALLKQLAKMQLNINFQTLNLLDAVDLAILLVSTTIEFERLSDGIVGATGQFPSCGGNIDVALITPFEGFRRLLYKREGNDKKKNVQEFMK